MLCSQGSPRDHHLLYLYTCVCVFRALFPYKGNISDCVLVFLMQYTCHCDYESSKFFWGLESMGHTQLQEKEKCTYETI